MSDGYFPLPPRSPFVPPAPRGVANSSSSTVYIVPLSAVSARTRSTPPITYWDQQQQHGFLNTSIWRHMAFRLKLRKTKTNRFVHLYCEPLPPLGTPAEFVEIFWCLEGSYITLNRFRAGAQQGNRVDFGLSGIGTLRVGTNVPESRGGRTPAKPAWSVIPESLRETLKNAGTMDLRVVLPNPAHIDTIISFFAEPAPGTSLPPPHSPPPLPRATNFSAPSLSILPPRPQTNPHLDPTIDDPFPGIPIALAPPLSTEFVDSPPPPADNLKSSQSSTWSFLDEGRVGASPSSNSSTSSTASSSSSSRHRHSESSRQATPPASRPRRRLLSLSPSPSLPPPEPTPQPRRHRRPPVIVPSESESDTEIKQEPQSSDAEITEVRADKKRTHHSEPKKKKKKKKQDTAQSAMDTDGEDASAEPVVHKKKKKRRPEPEPEPEQSAPESATTETLQQSKPRKKKKKSRSAVSPSLATITTTAPPSPSPVPVDSDGDISMTSNPAPAPPRKKKKTNRNREQSPTSTATSTTEDTTTRRDRLRRHLFRIQRKRHELLVKEVELKAKLHRLDFDSREAEDVYRAHCFCGACGKYGHRRNSVICELHPGRLGGGGI